MKLPQTAEYALRVVSQLALTEPAEKAVPAERLAEQTGIPHAFLSKIMRRLVTNGILVSQKGAGGGFKFARPLAEIRMMDVLIAAGYRFDVDHCVFGWSKCNADNPCPLHASWSEMKESFQHWAETTTLTDIKHPTAATPA